MTSTTTTPTTRTRTATTPTARTATAPPRRRANLALWGLQGVTGALFVFAALPKLTADPLAVGVSPRWSSARWACTSSGRSRSRASWRCWFPGRPVGLAGLAFVGLMIGAIVATLLTMGAAMVPVPAVVLVAAAVIAWGRRRRTAELIALVRRPAHR